MSGQQRKKDSLAGGLGMLAAVGWLCVKELRRVDARLKKKADAKRKET